jgi:hypothetical protein
VFAAEPLTATDAAAAPADCAIRCSEPGTVESAGEALVASQATCDPASVPVDCWVQVHTTLFTVSVGPVMWMTSG